MKLSLSDNLTFILLHFITVWVIPGKIPATFDIRQGTMIAPVPAENTCKVAS